MRLNKLGIILTSSALTVGLFSTTVSAAPNGTNQTSKPIVQVAASNVVYTKDDLIKKFRSYFPKQFDSLKSSDFQMSSGNYYTPEDETSRYSLSFTQTIEGKRVYGSVGFVGDNLDIEHFSYSPPIGSDALFPAKVSKDEARKLAVDFVKSLLKEDSYQLESDNHYYYPTRILTEPINYSFSFTKTKNDISISDNRVDINVLGNGQITSFYKYPSTQEKNTFDEVKNIKSEKDILNKLKENLGVELQYQVNIDYQSGERTVKLVYQPTGNFLGLSAATGKWLTPNGYTDQFPSKAKLKKIVEKPLPAKQKGITMEQAKKAAEKLLENKSDKLKLSIQSIDEIENYNGQTVYSIQYMYNHRNGGSGASIEINKATGEVIQYHNMLGYLMNELGEKQEVAKPISQKDALAKATSYIKEWIPSYLHNFSMPVDEPYYEENMGAYNFSFPRVVNGIIVSGDSINVGVSADGSLSSLYVNEQKVEEWPSLKEVISAKEAKTLLNNSLKVKLNYSKQMQKKDNKHYDLLYVPVYNDSSYSTLDATTGKWSSLFGGEQSSVVVSHPTAQEELNYLISTKILDVKDAKAFNGDAAITKGEALKILMNSLTYFYEGRYYYGNETVEQTFDNIDPKHPLFQLVERAVSAEIIKAGDKKFDVDSPVTREELSTWYIRVLGLEHAAKHYDIYKVNFEDTNKIKSDYLGYVALANKYGLFATEKNQFNPQQEVTYAEMSVSTIRLAHEIAKKGRYNNY
ncbi:YcdB/YcdC domain-containing protein [Psychrobacillus sp. FSL W7-1457]|uniref:YcdB/YcdC domain-containing protein n=1 Tax=unclassified Psychrobacillus TaxID=2636677 RepID=UPI0030F7E27C